jgi:hypothetical protein
MLGLSKKKSGAAQKRPKLKLAKEQKLFIHDMAKLENRIRVCCEYIDLWLQFFAQLSQVNEESEISPADERKFFQIMTALARKQFHFVESMGMTFDGDKDVMKVLCSAVSLSAIKMMNENVRDKFHLDWHAQFLVMNKSLGRLLRMMPGDHTLTENLASLRASNAQEKQDKQDKQEKPEKPEKPKDKK